MRGTIRRFVFFFFLPACLFGPFPSFAQKSGVLSKSTEAEAPAFGSANSNTTSLTGARKPNENWIPEDIDRAVPPVAPGVTCSLPAVLEGAGQRIKELVQNVDRFTSTAVLVHQEINPSGRMGRAVTVKFEYLGSISEERDGCVGV